ncbi:hypothetical protein CTI12_AA254970 [Artemisia annua]|uniref:RNA-directed DNA polymerase, eukaryota, Reverse transcriptase zinc-binding domain protein n=1 Tax=Artemisia annua TaxID=35608 RepID=A0A2U1NKV8_ARTAN|nr:hypothetical protein CTI12_AA254970 [Artemisia annua]
MAEETTNEKSDSINFNPPKLNMRNHINHEPHTHLRREKIDLISTQNNRRAAILRWKKKRHRTMYDFHTPQLSNEIDRMNTKVYRKESILRWRNKRCKLNIDHAFKERHLHTLFANNNSLELGESSNRSSSVTNEGTEKKNTGKRSRTQRTPNCRTQENRLACCPRLSEQSIKICMKYLEQNPYARFFRSLKDVPQLDNYNIVLKTLPSQDQRVYNKPNISQVAALWVEGVENGEQGRRNIEVKTHSDRSKNIEYYFGCYDALQYPLMFPFGELGWHQGILKKDEKMKKKRGRTEATPASLISPKNAASVEDLLFMEQNVMDQKDDSSKFHRKQVIRRSAKVASRAATKQRNVPDVGNDGNNEQVSDEHKETHIIGAETEAISGGDLQDQSESIQCESIMGSGKSLRAEEMKKIGEQIGIVWDAADKEEVNKEPINMEDILATDLGSGTDNKKRWIRELCRMESPCVLGLQETKAREIDEDWIEDLWGSKNFGFAQVECNGRSGGLIMVWDDNVFTCKDAVGDDRFIAIKGEWKGIEGDIVVVNVYGPHEPRQKTELWKRLTSLMSNVTAAWCFFGDFNET